MPRLWPAAFLLALLAPSAPAQEVKSIQVFPPDVSLETSRDRQGFVVQAHYVDGLTRDVTAEAKTSLSAPVAKLEGAALTPLLDGTAEMVVEYAGKQVKVPVTVKDAKADRPVSFRLDVMPVFMRTGCNAGSCHGAARGKDGFRLSLFGFDPDGDHFRLTRELNGRRVNLALPAEGLLVEKASGKVPHTGGARIAENDPYWNALIRWHDAGAPNDDPAKVATPTALEVYPKNAVLDGKGATQKLTVRAKYSDGTDRDVTNLTLFLTNNENSAKVSPDGTVTAGERGEAFVMARFATFTVGSPFVVLPKALKFDFPAVPQQNYIDALVDEKLKKLRIAPSPLCADEEFLRRVYIDVAGVLPSPEEFDRFVADKSPNKREKLVDELLGRKEFVEMWVMKWAELLQIHSTNAVSYKATLLYHNWLQDKIARNVPTDEWVKELLGASGGAFKSPASNYYQLENDPLKVTENVAQVFMGMRVQCAQCHNHPFDRWTMDDYYSFSAFFRQIGRKTADDPREQIIFNSGGGEAAHPLGGRVMPPKFLGGAAPDTKGKDRREVLAQWLASPDNPYFATNLANMVWSHFFGQGIIHEVDDVRISNPPSNGELLQELGKKFTEYKYDFKRLVRDICLSRTYQATTQPTPSNASDTRNFARQSVRRVRAETMLDCISQVTDTRNKFQGLPQGARAVQIADGNVTNYFLTTFGRATRETVCSCEVKLEPTLSQSLHLLNGDATTQRIRQGNIIGKRLAEKRPIPEIVSELYVRTLSRKPSPKEMADLAKALEQEPNKAQGLEDVFWALLNTREFMFNH